MFIHIYNKRDQNQVDYSCDTNLTLHNQNRYRHVKVLWPRYFMWWFRIYSYAYYRLSAHSHSLYRWNHDMTLCDKSLWFYVTKFLVHVWCFDKHIIMRMEYQGHDQVQKTRKKDGVMLLPFAACTWGGLNKARNKKTTILLCLSTPWLVQTNDQQHDSTTIGSTPQPSASPSNQTEYDIHPRLQLLVWINISRPGKKNPTPRSFESNPRLLETPNEPKPWTHSLKTAFTNLLCPLLWSNGIERQGG